MPKLVIADYLLSFPKLNNQNTVAHLRPKHLAQPEAIYRGTTSTVLSIRNMGGKHNTLPNWRAVRYAISVENELPIRNGVPSGTQHIKWEGGDAAGRVIRVPKSANRRSAQLNLFPKISVILFNSPEKHH